MRRTYQLLVSVVVVLSLLLLPAATPNTETEFSWSLRPMVNDKWTEGYVTVDWTPDPQADYYRVILLKDKKPPSSCTTSHWSQTPERVEVIEPYYDSNAGISLGPVSESFCVEVEGWQLTAGGSAKKTSTRRSSWVPEHAIRMHYRIAIYQRQQRCTTTTTSAPHVKDTPNPINVVPSPPKVNEFDLLDSRNQNGKELIDADIGNCADPDRCPVLLGELGYLDISPGRP